jgi:hypothetical protein
MPAEWRAQRTVEDGKARPVRTEGSESGRVGAFIDRVVSAAKPYLAEGVRLVPVGDLVVGQGAILRDRDAEEGIDQNEHQQRHAGHAQGDGRTATDH